MPSKETILKKTSSCEFYEEELKDSFKRWSYLKEYGGSDPTYSDGVNMNLIRNHIIYYKHKIEETTPPYPEIYYKDTPPEVDMDYIARPDEIRTHAAVSLSIFEKDDSFRFLQKTIKSISEQEAEKFNIRSVMGYEKVLRIAIYEDDLITMRRYEKPQRYIESFKETAEKLRNFVPEEDYQLSFF